MRYFISISYNGSAYSGWQIQDNAISVQQLLQRTLSIHLGQEISLTGAGRTDSGVNAINYIAHFDTLNPSPQINSSKFLYKINATLPRDIVVNNIIQVDDNAHARFDAIRRTYKYYVHTHKDPFALDFSYYYHLDLDLEAMNRGCSFLLGEKDFSSFEKLHGGNTHSVCSLYNAIWEPDAQYGDDYHFVFTISANRFLRNMVRAIVGSLLEVGRGKYPPEWIVEVLEKHDRGMAGQSVPGTALFLTEIKYPYSVFN